MNRRTGESDIRNNPIWFRTEIVPAAEYSADSIVPEPHSFVVRSTAAKCHATPEVSRPVTTSACNSDSHRSELPATPGHQR